MCREYLKISLFGENLSSFLDFGRDFLKVSFFGRKFLKSPPFWERISKNILIRREYLKSPSLLGSLLIFSTYLLSFLLLSFFGLLFSIKARGGWFFSLVASFLQEFSRELLSFKDLQVSSSSSFFLSMASSKFIFF